MGEQIVLTIGIPVYNGEKYISSTLDSILAQKSPIDAKNIEIIISDNASTDRTADIVDKYRKNESFLIRYFKNEINYGYDKNVDLVVTRAMGKYVWLLGCGEILLPNSLKYILGILMDDCYDNILLNFNIYSEKNQILDTDRNFSIDQDKVFLEKDSFYKYTHYGITPLSANIVFKDSWLSAIDEPLLVTGWVHVERIVKFMAHPDYKKSIIIHKICFTLKRDVDGWWTKNGNLLINSTKLAIVINSMKLFGYHQTTVKFLIDELYRNLFINIIKSKLTDLKLSCSLIYEISTVFKNRITFWLIYLPALLIPNFIYKFLKNLMEKIGFKYGKN